MTSPGSRLLAALAFASLGSGCGRTHAAPSKEDLSVDVRTVPVDKSPVSRIVRAAGTLATQDAWTLAFPSGGVVGEVRVRAGESVKKGAVLASLDLTPLTAQARRAREAFSKAERDLERARKLVVAEAAPASLLDDARTSYEVAAAALREAEFAVKRATLVAPEEGWVDRRLAEPGEIVGPGQPVLSVSGKSGGFVVKAGLAEGDVLGLALGSPASVRLDSRPEETLSGKISEIARSPSPATGTYEIRVLLTQPPKDLLAGLTAKVDIERPTTSAGTVPIAAVQEGDGSKGAVFTVRNGHAHRIPIEIAFLTGNVAVFARAPADLDRVVLEGASRLADGVPVHVTP